MHSLRHSSYHEHDNILLYTFIVHIETFRIRSMIYTGTFIAHCNIVLQFDYYVQKTRIQEMMMKEGLDVEMAYDGLAFDVEL